MKIIAFGASSSRNSINKKLASYTASIVKNADVEVIDINDFELPIYSEDVEKEIGHPQLAKDFLQKIKEADAVIVSFAEHNGSYTSAYKNLFDWASRLALEVYQNKPTIFLSTSPGPGGASSALKSAETSAPFFGVDLRGTLSVPNFYDVFDLENKRVKENLVAKQLADLVKKLSINKEMSK